MKNTILIWLFVLISFLGSSKISFASHFAAADLTYTYIGGNRYIVRVTHFRDCSGIPVIIPDRITISSSCFDTIIIINTFGTPEIATTACPSQQTCCSFPRPVPVGCLYGLEKYVFQDTITLPACSDYVFSWTNCCRNPSNTLLSPTSQNWYMPATLNNAVAPGNSSPYFTNMPATIICQGQNFCYNHGAIDPDGDSLVYSLAAPFQAAGTPVTYQGTYNSINPLPSSPPVSIDPLTGDICMTPTTLIIAVLGVKVEEWRRINGVATRIGTILRDIQINVISCSNNLIPDLAGINKLATSYSPNDTIYTLEVCLGETADFGVYANDNNIPDQNLTLTANNGIPGSFWSVAGNGTPNPIGLFFWFPTAADVSNTPHCFTVNVKDDNCPYVGQQTKSYCITVKNNSITLDPPGDTTLCTGQTYQIGCHSDTEVINYNWYIDGNYTASLNDTTLIINTSLLGPGQHTIACYDGGINRCPGSNKVIITVKPSPAVTVIASPQNICNGQSSTLSASGANTYLWLPDSVSGNTAIVTPNATTIYTVVGTDSMGCSGSATTSINVYYTINISVKASPAHICSGQSTILTATGASSYLWEPDSLTGDSLTLWPLFTTTYTVTGELNGCKGSDTITVVVNPVPEVKFTADIFEGCEDLRVNFTDLSNFPNAYWIWNFGDHSYSYLQNPHHIYIDDGVYDVSLKILSPLGCSSIFTWPEMIRVYEVPVASFTPVPDRVNELEPTIAFIDNSIGATLWNWYFGDTNPVNNTSDIQNPVHTYSATGAYTVTLAAATEHGCVDTFKYVIHVIPNVTFYIPNAFSPGNDGKNDGFKGKGTGIIESTFEMYIFNQWGEEIYTSTDINAEWNGTDKRKGEKCQQDIYSWLVRFKDVLGRGRVLTGTVLLLR